MYNEHFIRQSKINQAFSLNEYTHFSQKSLQRCNALLLFPQL